MFTRRFLALFLLFSVTAMAGDFEVYKTKIRDQKAAKLLKGKHFCSLQWLGLRDLGVVKVTEKNGVWKMEGSQFVKGGDYLSLSGKIREISADKFVFYGWIQTKVSYLNDGEVHRSFGDYTFAITKNRKYWRMQEMDVEYRDGPSTNYVDIYFKGPR